MIERPKLSRLRLGLSARLLLLTILFVMVAEVFIYVPSIAQFRKSWLEERLAAAQIAALALVATSDFMVSDDLAKELLANAQVQAVVLKRGDSRKLILGDDMPINVTARYDLRKSGPVDLVVDAFTAMRRNDDGLIEVTGRTRENAGEYVQIILKEMPLSEAMYAHTRNVVFLSLMISLITASLMCLSLLWLMVRPITRIAASMMAFREAPEDGTRVMTPSGRSDEIGMVQRELGEMQEAVRAALHQKTHLANLGGAVAKINHDLRNILASAHLISDRLNTSQDPTVMSVAPRLLRAINRAVNLCQQTLEYSKSDESAPRIKSFEIRSILEEVASSLGLDGAAATAIVWRNDISSDLLVNADPEHIFRALLNLCRNAQQILEIGVPPSGRQEILARGVLTNGAVMIEIEDSGPGFPAQALQYLFEPFRGNARSGGTGLGLAIARELIVANGGAIELAHSDSNGTVFRITLPAGQASKTKRRAR